MTAFLLLLVARVAMFHAAWMSTANVVLCSAARQAHLLRKRETQSLFTSAPEEAQVGSVADGHQIPLQLVLTAKQASLGQMAKAVQDNIRRTMQLSPGLVLRWLGDRDCFEYISSHYDDELARFYAEERVGMYRGDLCRAAVLAREGGFYTDLDVQMKEPLTSLVAQSTTFMSAFAHTADRSGKLVLNAVMASVPRNPIMMESIEQMRLQYKRQQPISLLGPTALRDAIHVVAEKLCGGTALKEASPEWQCGSEIVRMYKEMKYSCWGQDAWPSEFCPRWRAVAMYLFPLASYGIFTWENKLIGWSRMEDCDELGCEGGGHEESDSFLK